MVSKENLGGFYGFPQRGGNVDRVWTVTNAMVNSMMVGKGLYM